MLEKLKREVYNANMLLPKMQLVTFTWGNVSGIDRTLNLMVIKPSGVAYDKLTVDDMVVVDLDGNIIESNLNPSTDTPTHIYLYKKFPDLAGICHTHSIYATTWCQAGIDLPTQGTTHADNFYGDIPCTEHLSATQINNYEHETGVIIYKTFRAKNLNPEIMPAVLCNNHGPFTFGHSPAKAVEMAKILEITAQMTFQSYLLNKNNNHISKNLLDKHYQRKHGKNSYYGQKSK